MAENRNTAERELLKTIEGVSAVKQKTPAGSGAFLGMLLDKKASFTRLFSPGSLQNKITLDLINKLLFLSILALIAVNVFVYFKGEVKAESMPEFKVSNLSADSMEAKEIMSPLEDYAYYSGALLSRNIFKFPEKEKETHAALSSGIQNKLKNLKLVGISWDRIPNERFVMIEDIQVAITHYVQEGDSILNFLVEEISEEKVTLSYSGQQVELR